ncbi:MAG: hypothetical protein AB8G22_15345 [Saprospiraceae bacterium]
MKNLHRISGILVSIFIIAHLSNHAMAWFGIAIHQSILASLRKVYRIPIIEIILVAAFLLQAVSGVRLFFQLRKKGDKSSVEKIKMYSGLIIGLFIIQHIPATIGQRILLDIDTNFYFAANVVLQEPLLYYFIPYYFLGIMAFGTHLAVIHREKVAPMVGLAQAKIHYYLILGLFLILTILILYVFTGNLYEIEIPAVYQMY